MKLLIILLAGWNVITFSMMGIDKFKAKKDLRRISEKTLLLNSFFMGALGALAGSLVFNHKTSKVKFRILLPLFTLLNAAVVTAVIYFRINP
ncbi:MAG: DUF1294 domain-containing protein [Firmicutes bacterium]|nr:DUF1294 domain-containing protein [Bacillota bacterium]